ncbi:hypothetical protein NpPPO83_00007736 [Neofusicoccum parvum]|uniref:Uncharacterized protein n=1 Tax=Neofusicoccum parvum TaxID=310453 RepID=A0ACB5SI63_9PEZI|nr:hypothetical protein NpPPO83_00007736 [Neofusicoccum parvum]
MVSSLYLSTIAALVATVYGTGVATVVNKCSGNVNAQIISNDGNGAESTVSPGGTFYGNVYSTTPYNIKLWDNNGSELQLETVLSDAYYCVGVRE